MKFSLLLLKLFFSMTMFGQEVPVLKPVAIHELDFSPEYIKKFYSEQSNCEKVFKKMEVKGYKLTKAEEKILESCHETYESPWEIIGQGCSWYCLGGGDSVTASSQLANQGKNNYDPANAHDLDYETAWVEGAKGSGKGEYLLYHFRPDYPTAFHTVIVANGYVKSQNAWINNSRVKKLKMYVNGKPFSILELEDKRADQYFSLPLVQFSKIGGVVKFEIMEVYPGEKYEDAVITEIYFDGPSH